MVFMCICIDIYYVPLEMYFSSIKIANVRFVFRYVKRSQLFNEPLAVISRVNHVSSVK